MAPFGCRKGFLAQKSKIAPDKSGFAGLYVLFNYLRLHLLREPSAKRALKIAVFNEYDFGRRTSQNKISFANLQNFRRIYRRSIAVIYKTAGSNRNIGAGLNNRGSDCLR